MKHYLYKLSLWWFATMTPEYGPSITIIEREKLRKRRLLSILALISFVITFACIPLGIFVHDSQSQLGMIYSMCIAMLLTLWINKRGFQIGAGLFFLLSSSFLEMVLIISEIYSMPILAVSVWPMLLISLIVGGFFLPAWGPMLQGMILMLFVTWVMLVGCQHQISLYIVDVHLRNTVLIFSDMIIIAVSVFSAVSTLNTNKAVIRADRATELEQAHQSLSTANEKLEVALAHIQKQALTDVLTDLPNHRAIMEQLTKELEHARRYEHPFSLLFFDTDRFKQVNDTYGHTVGDVILYQIGERVGRVLRSVDTLGRFGGEEFVILLPEADAHEACLVAERVRSAVANGPMATAEVAGGIDMTVSIGLATYTVDGSTEQELMSRADEAMYIAKNLGRNQVRTPEDVRRAQMDLPLQAFLKQQERCETAQR